MMGSGRKPVSKQGFPDMQNIFFNHAHLFPGLPFIANNIYEQAIQRKENTMRGIQKAIIRNQNLFVEASE